jgi:hypothetical protein
MMVSSGINFIKVNKNVPDGSRTETYRWINKEMYDLRICIHSFILCTCHDRSQC